MYSSKCACSIISFNSNNGESPWNVIKTVEYIIYAYCICAANSQELIFRPSNDLLIGCRRERHAAANNGH